MVPSKVKGQTSGQKVKCSKWYYICIVGFLSIHGTEKNFAGMMPSIPRLKVKFQVKMSNTAIVVP